MISLQNYNFLKKYLIDHAHYFLLFFLSLFNGISTLVGYLTPKLISLKYSSGTI